MKIRSIGDCHCMALRRAARRISQMYDDALAPAGLGSAQFSMLATLSAANGMSVSQLAERLDLDPTTTGKNLRPLERDCLIEVRVSAEDRRSRVVALTHEGHGRLAVGYPLWAAAQAQFERSNGRKGTAKLREQLRELRIDSKQIASTSS